MLFYTITALVNAITSIVLGLLVYSKNKKADSNKIFAIFCLSVATWAAFYFCWIVLGTTKPIALLFGRALNIAAIFIAITYFHLIIVFLDIYREHKKIIIAGYILSFFLFLSGFTPFFVKDVQPELSFPWYPKPGFAYHVFTLMFFSFVVYSWYLMFKGIRSTVGERKDQIKYVLFGTLVGFIGGSTSFLPVYGIPIPPFGNIFVASYIISIAYAITKHHLFGIKVILTEILVGVIGIILFVEGWLSASIGMRILNWVVFLLFCIFGYYLIKATIDEIRRREQIERISRDLEKAYSELKKLDMAKSEFISIASHQLRTPLTAIKGYVSLIIDHTYGQFPVKMSQPLKNVFSSVERLIRLVNDLLSISRIESGKMEIEAEEFALEDLIASIVVELKNLVRAKKLYLKWEKPEVKLEKVFLDRTKIRQVILNIIDNAIKYTETGGITVRYGQKKDLCEIDISDTGAGMTKSEIEKVFKSFSRGTAGRKTWTEGAGLGLYIAKQFVEMHNGSISARSSGKGKGSTFHIKLPIKYAQETTFKKENTYS